MKALPYGISDFPRIRCEDYYYVDKSRFIEILERQPPYLFLIRPRRSGITATWFCDSTSLKSVLS